MRSSLQACPLYADHGSFSWGLVSTSAMQKGHILHLTVSDSGRARNGTALLGSGRANLALAGFVRRLVRGVAAQESPSHEGLIRLRSKGRPRKAMWTNYLTSAENDSIGQVASATLGALVGAAATLLVVFLTPKAQRRDRYDAALLTRRMAAYDQLQQALEPTSRFREALGHPLDLEELAAALTRWYYEGHGLYMTVATRDLFFKLRDGLRELSRDEIVELASALRSQMTADLNSRRPPLLG